MKANRLGEVAHNKWGDLMEIIEYNKSDDMVVRFSSGATKKTNYCHFKSGKVKDPNMPSVFGFGYIGVGNYKTSYNGKHTEAYSTWKNMLERCLTNSGGKPYQNATVDHTWFNFQNFASWYYENSYTCDKKLGKLQLDKDLLSSSKKYSPSTCCLLPSKINTYLAKKPESKRGCPRGVYIQDNCTNRRYKAQIRNPLTGDREHSQGFKDMVMAGEWYLERKKEILLEIAGKMLSSGAPECIYDALIDYSKREDL